MTKQSRIAYYVGQSVIPLGVWTLDYLVPER